MPSLDAIILASGASKRYLESIGSPYESDSKLYADISGYPVLWWSIFEIAKISSVSRIFPVINFDSATIFQQKIVNNLPVDYRSKIKSPIRGGNSRLESLINGFEFSCKISSQPSPNSNNENENENDLILIHDGARPLINSDDVEQLIQLASITGAAILSSNILETVKQVNPSENIIKTTINREQLIAAKTPQIFRRSLLQNALKTIKQRNIFPATITDDSQLLELIDYPVHYLNGNNSNIKITTEFDLNLVRYLIQNSTNDSANH